MIRLLLFAKFGWSPHSDAMACSNSSIRTQIANIDTALASGAKSITLDGVTVTLDFDALREERKRLERLLPESKRRRPLSFTVNMG